PRGVQDEPRVETKIDGLGLGLASLGETTESAQSGFQRAVSLGICGACRLPIDRAAKIVNGLVPDFAVKSMIGEPLDVVGHPVGVEALDGVGDACVQQASALVEQPTVRDLVRQRVSERVLDLREELRFVDELCGA